MIRKTPITSYSHIMDQRMHIPGNSSSEIHLSSFEGVDVFSVTSYQEKQSIYPELQEVPYLHMYFSLEGLSSRHEKSGEEYTLSDNQHALSFKPFFDGHYSVSSPKAKSFGVSMPPTFFERLVLTDNDFQKRFWDKVLAGDAIDMTTHPMPITAQQKAVIFDIQHCPYTGQMKKLHYEAKIMELFLLQAEQAERLNGKRPSAIKPQDAEKIHAARQFVNQHMLEPISLTQISKATGLNEFKLKRGFKLLFGTTVFEHLTDQKMNYARQMLLNTSCSVFEVAYTLGYTEPYNFTKAFKKHFGYVPSELKESFKTMY